MVYTEKHGRWKPVNWELVSTGHKAHSRVYVKFEIKKKIQLIFIGFFCLAWSLSLVRIQAREGLRKGEEIKPLSGRIEYQDRFSCQVLCQRLSGCLLCHSHAALGERPYQPHLTDLEAEAQQGRSSPKVASAAGHGSS